ncbi:hypothetical protein BDV38DRAFT_231716 [Aspergillus pseudotamarii]|uniref:Uncharacterized protein n=1 Tax=Aspergillus pseudotamarii TaxID=132259 RepID=A0A5N6TBF3_ASPPS|nr:uncharacterized protein BDV38DRAFT_231716 [Aspergillus pseudotamarii]KAE8143600.1 hypothetical protein BDV38DRAFT_231716 [Aspergillus pseudotamarii]
MSYNQIISKKTVSKIIKNGREVTISVATKTSHWIRPDVAADAVGDAFTKAVEGYTGELPADTKDVCARESEHSSTDPRDHFTGVCFNSKNEGQSVHFPTKK